MRTTRTSPSARGTAARSIPETFSYWFLRHGKAGLLRIRLDDVRHSSITAALGNGEPMMVVSLRVGHSSIGITSTPTAMLSRQCTSTVANLILGAG